MRYICNRCHRTIDEMFIDKFETYQDKKVVCLECGKLPVSKPNIVDDQYHMALKRSEYDETIHTR